MLFQFAPAVQAAIEAHKYVQVFTSAGVPIGMARDPLTGQFVAHAIGAVVQNSPLSPLLAASQFVTAGVQMGQNHLGFQGINRRVDTGFQGTHHRLDVIQAGLQALQVNPLIAPIQLATSVVTSGAQMVQTHKGFQKTYRELEIIQTSLRLLQASVGVLSQQSAIAGYKTLVPANLQKASDLAVANLYWYFKVRDETEQEEAIAQ